MTPPSTVIHAGLDPSTSDQNLVELWSIWNRNDAFKKPVLLAFRKRYFYFKPINIDQLSVCIFISKKRHYIMAVTLSRKHKSIWWSTCCGPWTPPRTSRRAARGGSRWRCRTRRRRARPCARDSSRSSSGGRAARWGCIWGEKDYIDTMRTFVQICVYVHVCVYTYVYVYTDMCICMIVCVYIDVFTICMHMFVYIHMHVLCIHMRIHISTYI